MFWDKDFEERRKKLAEMDTARAKAKFMNAPQEFSSIIQKREQLIQSLQGKSSTIQYKIIRQIWDLDIELEQKIEWYATRKASGYTGLTREMSGWKPFGDDKKFGIYKERKTQVGSGLYGSKALSDETIENIIIGYPLQAKLVSGTYPEFDDALGEILDNTDAPVKTKGKDTEKEKQIAITPEIQQLKEPGETTVDIVLNKLKNHRIVSFIIIIGCPSQKLNPNRKRANFSG